MIDLVLCASGRDEVRLVHDLAHARSEIRVVRRCADLAETLAVVAAGIGDAVLLDVAVRGLTRDHLRTMQQRVPVIALDDGEDSTALSVAHRVPRSASAEEVMKCVRRSLDGTVSAAPDAPSLQDPADHEPASGRILAVWGPVGAPGRSTIAINLAAETAQSGTPTLLVDADTYGPCLNQMLGLLEESGGITAACRAHDRDGLDADTLATLIDEVRPQLRLLAGIGTPRRWPELRPGSLEALWSLLRRTAALTVVDVAPHLEEDEDLSYDTAAPLRNAATLSALRAADAVIAVVAADPVSITRLLRQRDRLQEIGVDHLQVIINRLGHPVAEQRIHDLLARRMEIEALDVLPDDPVACRTAAWEGTVLAETAPRSPLRRALRRIAVQETTMRG